MNTSQTLVLVAQLATLAICIPGAIICLVLGYRTPAFLYAAIAAFAAALVFTKIRFA